MKIQGLIIILLFTISCCQQKVYEKDGSKAKKVYSTVSYLDIKLDENGHLPSNPYILEFKNGKKQIMFCGVEHLSDNSDIENEMYTEIEKKFYQFHPDIAINEGGDISRKKYFSKAEALQKDGEIGFIKVMSDSLKIATINGDPNIDLEFGELLKSYTKGEFLTYIMTERLMWGLIGEQISDIEKIENRYDLFIEKYIIEKGKVDLSSEEKTFDFYKKNYRKIVGRDFSLKNLKPTNPFDAKGKFQEIGRKSKNIRDQFLLKTIDNLLNENDKIFIVFGGWHLLTCEPGLQEIIKKNR
ncbi:hypothetical protein SAMN05421813_104214 [Daejeonella rubra]|uniref:TraB family protein n=1 Tax=Daejeonella rubra TaxID=990371 RepID=A0A1G9PP87_9SPHI|nr:hypothetical protein [Daejeonella rubra]SDM00590.1 hypothetical protein SAMN05421813_104214 [Daejeonella rubra]